jgi:anti-sigma factor RsiW
MNCHSFINILDLHREGRLSPRRARAAASHLAVCPGCRARFEPTAAPVPSAPAPQALKDKLLAAAKSRPEANAARAAASDLPLWPREARGIALAAAALLIVGLLISASGAPSQSTGGTVAAVEEP